MLINNMFILVFTIGLSWCSATNSDATLHSCPPKIPVSNPNVCEQSCGIRGRCKGSKICCPTDCGGAVCSDPITELLMPGQEKAGSCPSNQTGAWICTSTCRGDGDCRGVNKCCSNRCEALICVTPVL